MFASKDTLLTRPSGGYSIARSVRLRSSATAYFNRTFGTPTTQNIWTWSGWIKRGVLTGQQWFFGAGGTSNPREGFNFLSDNTLDFTNNTGGSPSFNITTTQVFRDPSAWYHIIIAFDSTQATASNRIKVYVNGTQVTSFSTASYPSLNANAQYINSSGTIHNIGALPNGTGPFDGYLTEINFIDGQALTPSSFGETDSITGVWKAKKYGGTYGTNGFYLNFSDNSNNTAATIGKDYSGNGNNWTPNNISVTSGVTYDSMVDSPTVGATSSNYAVMNPIVPTGSNVFGNGNLTITGVATYCNGLSTIALGTGAFYAECTVTTHSAEAWGVYDSTKSAAFNIGAGTAVGCYGIYSGGATLVTNGSGGATNSGATPANGDVVQVAWNNGSVWVGKNNTWYDSSFGTTGNPSAGTNATFTGLSTANIFCFVFGNGNAASVLNANFGQRPFSYTPPTGFVALNTYNLPASTIKNGAAYMAATLYTGNLTGQSITNTINGASFQPDLVWIKSRSAATDHKWTDSVRGATKALISNTTAAETTDVTGVTAINSNGFTVGASTVYNNSAVTYVAWQWLAGASAGSSNTNGSITSTVSVGATQGFSVATFSGASAGTVGHGLGVVPQMIFIKSRTTVTGWYVYTSTIGANGWLVLETSAAAVTGNSAAFGGTSPTSTVWSFGSGLAGTGNYVAYCFTPVAGYSAFGSYTGNGSADGPFVYTGFKPRWVLIKNSGQANDWFVMDSSMNTYNVIGEYLYPNSSAASVTNSWIDFLSNGFKIRSTATGNNNSSIVQIYAAFAENPMKYALAR